MNGSIHRPLGFCPRCGPFESTAIALGPGVTNVFFSNGSTSCPTCYGTSELIPGNYSTVGNKLRLLVDQSISEKALAALRRLAEQALEGRITPEKAKEEAEKVAPGTGRLFDIRNWSEENQTQVLTALVAIIGAAIVARCTPPTTVNLTIQPAIERVIERPALMSTSSLKSISLPPLPERKPKSRR